ncbi:hypothetical protein Tco_0528079 [Tanacetum coccineum]
MSTPLHAIGFGSWGFKASILHLYSTSWDSWDFLDQNFATIDDNRRKNDGARTNYKVLVCSCGAAGKKRDKEKDVELLPPSKGAIMLVSCYGSKEIMDYKTYIKGLQQDLISGSYLKWVRIDRIAIALPGGKNYARKRVVRSSQVEVDPVVNGIYNPEKVLKMLDRVFKHKSMECTSILHQPDGVGSQGGHLGSFGKVNGILVALVARTIIKHRVEDVQLGVKSYQTKLNLTNPQVSAPDVGRTEPYTIFYKPRGVTYESRNRKRCLMREDEVYMPTRPWLNRDERQAMSMVKVLEKTLHRRRIIRSLECYVSGRNHEADYMLLTRTD